MRLFAYYLLVPFLFSGSEPTILAEQPAAEYKIQTEVRIPMRDGVHLGATVYRPYSTTGPLPVILHLTPYPDDAHYPGGSYFASHGYIYADLHVRGRGESEGVFDPYAHDGQDGYDAVEWFAKQPWCNGKVAMDGGSYVGADQFLVAAMHPPHLVTIVPVAAARGGEDYPGEHRIVMSYMTEWLTLTSGHVLYEQVFDDGAHWSAAWKHWYMDKAAFKDLDAYGGTPSKSFQTTLQHPDLDDFWRARGGTSEQIAGIHLPMLQITGFTDGDENGSLSFYKDHLSDPGNAQQSYLVIGPWNHGGTRVPKQDFDGMHFGPASLVNVRKLELEWYDYTMKGGPKPAFLKDHLMYYVAGDGAECWKSAASLEQAASKSLTFYPDATGDAKSVYHSGVLSPARDNTQGGEWISNPNDLSGAEPEDVEVVDPDKQPGADLHGNGLVFHSAPFSEPTELDGRMDLRLWLSIDAPDTDLRASLTLILPNGHARMLTEGVMRARYRYSEEHPEAIRENQPEEYRIPPFFPFFAMRAPKGSRLRLVLSSLNNSFFEKNWNSMKPVAEQTGADARIAHIRLLQTPEHPSTLTLSLGEVGAECKASAEW